MNFKKYFKEELSSHEKKVIGAVKKAGVKVKMLKDSILGKRPASRMSSDRIKDLLIKDGWKHEFVVLPAGSSPGSFDRFTKKDMRLEATTRFDRVSLTPVKV